MSSRDKELDDWLRGVFSGRIGLPMLERAGAGGWLGGVSGDTSRQKCEEKWTGR